MVTQNYRTLSVLADFPHGFFCRHGGVSDGLLSSLNCQLARPHYLHRTDALKNFHIAQEALGLGAQELHAIHLIHTDNIYEPQKGHVLFPNADASFTNNPDLIVSVTTADCAPILLGHSPTRTVSAVHVGWKGALLNILGKTLAQFSARGIDTRTVHAGIGPCIHQKHLKLNKMITQNFIEKDAYSNTFFHEEHLNLRGYCAHQLTQAGVTHIEHLDIDTYVDENFFSARRARHRCENIFGAQPSLISPGHSK